MPLNNIYDLRRESEALCNYFDSQDLSPHDACTVMGYTLSALLGDIKAGKIFTDTLLKTLTRLEKGGLH